MEETVSEKRRTSRMHHIVSLIQSGFILVLIFLIIFMMIQINNLQGTARVINYAGIVRGATQREIKLEITGTTNDTLITYLDNILSGLKNGEGTYNLVSIKDPVYQENLDNQIAYWQLLKDEIYAVRESGYEATNIVAMSELYFGYADETVTAAEKYSEKIAYHIRVIELISAVDMLFLIFFIISQQVQAVKSAKENRLLSKKAYLDIHTGLPNKSRCEELLHNSGFITEPLCFVMFDLNNLKVINDTFGHAAGDSMIADFARILRKTMPEKDFVGRYGGDEFITILYDTDTKEAERLLQLLYSTIEQYNSCSMQTEIRYAYGYSFSLDYNECTLRTLLDKADHNMYLNKKESKKER